MVIDVLPDDAFLQIFDFYRMNRDRGEHHHSDPTIWGWHRLAHVCQRWRQIVFASPRRLNLQILCTHGTPVRKNLDCLPTFPIVVDYCRHHENGVEITAPASEDYDNVIAALEHSDRVCSIRMSATYSLLEMMDIVLQRSFPMLTSVTLQLALAQKNRPILPKAFLGGSAPHLQQLDFRTIAFPTLPTLLQSTNDLVELRLLSIPSRDGYIPPGMMVASLAALSKLEVLSISFEFRTYRPAHGLAERLSRIVLHSLTRFLFDGAREYLEELAAQIETPRLANLMITFCSSRTTIVQVPHLLQFVGRAEHLMLANFRRARIHFENYGTHISLDRSQAEGHPRHLDLKIGGWVNWQVSTITQFFSQSSAIISDVRHLSMSKFTEEQSWPLDGSMGVTEWFGLLRPFTAVETLHICNEMAELVVPVFEDFNQDMVVKMLPALQLLNLEGQLFSTPAVKKFIAVRQRSGRPVTVVNHKKKRSCAKCFYYSQLAENEGSKLLGQSDPSSSDLDEETIAPTEITVQ